MSRVYLGIPYRDGISGGTCDACFKTGIPWGKWDGLELSTRSTSLLTFTFNEVWVGALNTRPYDAFCMIHDDVVPMDPDWLRTLLEERERVGADILSAVIPIKDERGFSSTAVYDPSHDHHQRVTMTEAVEQLPKTFDASDYGIPDGSILPNTGLWVCDFSKPWVEEVCFTIKDRIFNNGEKWIAQCLSEDWNFGYWCRKRGLRVMATTVVRAVHRGNFNYPNFVAYGTEKVDKGYGYFPGASS